MPAVFATVIARNYRRDHISMSRAVPEALKSRFVNSLQWVGKCYPQKTVQTNLFRSFFQAGYECSTHITNRGTRLDVVAASHHDIHFEKDFRRLREQGISTVREGLRWHLISPAPGAYDFSSVLPLIEEAQRQEIEVIWDLCHFGWPDYLDVFSEEWANRLAELAAEFAHLLRSRISCDANVIPINEISFLAWGGGEVACMNPFTRRRGTVLKRSLVRGAIGASRVLRSELPGVRLISAEPVIHIAPRPGKPGDVFNAARHRLGMFEAWDMILGRKHSDLGGNDSLIDIFGINFYSRNQWHHRGQTIHRSHPEYRAFRDILREVHSRYDRPLFVSETGHEDDERTPWLTYIAGEVFAAMDAGIPVNGVCLYPVLNHPGWDDDRHCRNGLWDYADENGHRNICQPLADRLASLQSVYRNRYGSEREAEESMERPTASGAA